MIYLDHNATTPLDPRVREAMEPILTEFHGNPSSVHSAGRAARRAVEEARADVAELLGASEPDEIVFTSGGTEADALAIAAASEGGKGRRIAITAVEHPAVREPARAAAASGGRLDVIPVGPGGGLDRARFEKAIASGASLVSVMFANNEYGEVFPVEELAATAHSAGALFHTDAVAALGKISIDVRELEVDLLSVSAHKIGGPKGVGALYVRRGLDITPLYPGGGQERRRRGGTENVAGIVGFGEAARLARREWREESARVRRLRDFFEERIRSGFPHARIWGLSVPRIGNTSAVAFPGSSAEAMMIRLDLAGIAVSLGSACSSGTTSPSPAILALGASPEDARATLRFSFGRGNREEQLGPVFEALAAGGP